MGSPCLSSRPLLGSEYTDGQIYDLHLDERSALKMALLQENWINLADSQPHWIDLMQSDQVKFVGTIVSVRRQQIQVTIIFKQLHPVYGGLVEFCVTLLNFRRFQHL